MQPLMKALPNIDQLTLSIDQLTLSSAQTGPLQPVIDILQALPTDTLLKRKSLEKAYELLHPILIKTDKPTRDVAFILSKILTQFGQSLYGDTHIPNHFSTAREFLLSSFNAQFYALGMHDSLVDFRRFASLSEMIPLLAEQKIFYRELNSKTTDFNHEVVAIKVAGAGLSEDELFNLAFTLRFLNGTYRSLGDNQKQVETEELILKRYVNFIELATAVLSIKESPQIKLELRELRYNDLPSYYAALQKPELVRKNYDDLEKEALNPLDRAMLVRIYNKQACNTNNREEQLLYMGKAKDQYEHMLPQERHPILYPLFLNNYGFVILGGISLESIALSPNDLTPELSVVKGLFFKAHALVTDLRQGGTENVNFLNIDCNYIRFNLFLGQLDEAEKTIAHAERVLQKNPENGAMKEKIDLLHAKLELLQGKKFLQSDKTKAFQHFQKTIALCEKYPTNQEAVRIYSHLKNDLPKVS